MSDQMQKNKQLSFLAMLRKLLPVVIKASPGWVIGPNLFALPHGMMWGFSILVNQYFFDAVAGVVGKSVQTLLWPTLLLGTTLIVLQILNGLENFFLGPAEMHLAGKLNLVLAQKAARIDPIAFEDPAFLDDINKAREGVIPAYDIVHKTLLNIPAFYLSFLVVSGTLFFRIKPILLLALALVFVPTVLLQIVRTKLYTQLEEKAAPLRRQYEYYEKTLSDRAFFKETRLLGAFMALKRLYSDTMGLLNREMWKTEKKSTMRELSLRLLSLVGYMGILILLFMLLMRGEISVGSFAAVFGSIGLLFGIMEECICYHVAHLAKDIGKVRNFVRFLDMPEREGSDALAAVSGDITLENVTFRYPGKEKDTLCGITLHIKAGETLAIVGSNGAGKSTLVRLISGLYLPKEGRVIMGGTDTRLASPHAIYKGISAVFQKFQRYRMTLRDNVEISRYDQGDSEEALRKADVEAKDASFPHGLDTMLSREFEGVDLSGGQWQRIAIARGYHRDHDLILLDEPTAAIDPLQESKIYHQFAQLSKGKTAILVTHRMGSAKIADRICVLDQGKIDDIGTHEQLLSRRGLYAMMWKAQAQWYDT